jgi:amino acid transporter
MQVNQQQYPRGSWSDFLLPVIGIAVAPAILGLVQNSAPNLESGLKLVFLVGALTMLTSLLRILTISEISMDAGTLEKSEPLKTIPMEG